MSFNLFNKDCFYHLMRFLPCPMDKRNLVLSVGTIEVRQAFQESSLWKQWEELNIVDRLFLLHPKVICLVLNKVKRINKVILKFEEDSLFPCYEIIRSIQQSDKEEWNATELEIDIQTMAYTEPIFVDLISIVMRKLGNSVLTVKFHVNERSMANNMTAMDKFFDTVIHTQKFTSVTSFDLKSFGRNVGPRLEQVINRMSVKCLKISGLYNAVPTLLNGVIQNLQELHICDCDCLIPEFFLSKFGASSFPNMEKVCFTSPKMYEGIRWHGVARQCFNHCNFDVTITEPLIDAQGEDIEELNFDMIKGLLENFIKTQIPIAMPPDINHQVTLGQRYKKNGLYCFHIRRLEAWLDTYGFESERKERWLEFTVKPNCKIILLCGPRGDLMA